MYAKEESSGLTLRLCHTGHHPLVDMPVLDDDLAHEVAHQIEDLVPREGGEEVGAGDGATGMPHTWHRGFRGSSQNRHAGYAHGEHYRRQSFDWFGPSVWPSHPRHPHRLGHMAWRCSPGCGDAATIPRRCGADFGCVPFFLSLSGSRSIPVAVRGEDATDLREATQTI